MHAKGLDRSGTATNKITHGLVAFVRYPYRSKLAGAQQLGQSNCVAPVGLHLIARLLWNQGWRNDDAAVAKRCDQAMQPVAGWSGFIAKMNTIVRKREADPTWRRLA